MIDKLMRQMWWKYLGLVILAYVFSAGFLVPLKPGIMNVSPDRLTMGMSHTLIVDMYNTSFEQEDNLHAFVRLDQEHMVGADRIVITDPNTIMLDFLLPGDFPGASNFAAASLVVHDPENGFIVSPSALTLEKEQDYSANQKDTLWKDRTGLSDGPWKLQFPFIGILYETIRNTFFHVAIWFAMFFLMLVSLVYSLNYLGTSDLRKDAMAASFAHVSIVFGTMGLITGSIWAKNTWGVYWTNDPKLNMSAVAFIIYVAYALLRSAITDPDQRARLSAAYNIFAVVAFIPLVFVIPRLTSSLHPGNGGNPAMGGEDLDNTLRLFFYPAILGFILIGTWMATLLTRLSILKIKLIDQKL